METLSLGLEWCGAVRCGAVRCGAVRCGAVRCGAVRIRVYRGGAVAWLYDVAFFAYYGEN
ncbi:hypothetical protein HX52_12420 [Salmonella enterica]|nr:hypothetical protein [Salmonella enterica]EDU6133742.1 hypothetical protein [Salmonella enterica subsp. enterica]